MDYTYRDIQNMSDEEVGELNRELGAKVLKKFLIFHGLKWGLIFGLSYAARKYFDHYMVTSGVQSSN